MSRSVIINSKNRLAPADTPNDATYYFDWSAFEEGKYKVSWSIYRAPVAAVVALATVVAQTPFQTLLGTKAPWGQYSATSWVAGTNTLTDLTGNGRHATTTNLTSGMAAGNGTGAGISIAYLAGSPTGKVVWPAGSIPATYTIAFLTRYATTGAYKRILVSGGNYLFGHYNGGRGPYFDSAFKTTPANVGVTLNWLNMVVTNSTGVAVPGNALIDGGDSGIANGGSGVAALLAINSGTSTGECSDFQFSQLIIWDQALTATEMATVAAALNTYLATGVLQ